MVLADKLRRPSALAAASLLTLATLVPLLNLQKVNAYGLLGSRSITISSSQVSAVNQSYKVDFLAETTANVQGIVVDFCQNSPIIGDTCTAPAGFDIQTGVTVTAQTANVSTFTIDTSGNADANTIILTDGTGASLTNGDPVSFTFTSVDNPSALGTFYARILTYDTGTNANAYTPVATGGGAGTVDAGGIALSTAAQITVTAKVQERLEFCVYTTGAGNDCTGKSGTAVTLGDNNGVLSPTGAFVDKNAKYSVTTNASGSAVIRAKGATLTSGAFTVDAIGGGIAAANSTPGTEQFGFCTYETAGAGLTAAADSSYNGGTNCSTTTQSAGTATPGGVGTATFDFRTADLTSTYGDDIAVKAAGDYSTGTLAFVGNISNTTEAGIYTTTLTFIATGTY